MESNTAIRRMNIATPTITAGGPPSMPARTMVLREEGRWAGSATAASFERARDARRARKREQIQREYRLACANAAYVGRDLVADMRAARREREMRERGISSISTRASRLPARS